MRTHILATLFLCGAAAPALGAGDPLEGKFSLADATKGLGGGAGGKLTATIQTSMGTFTCELFDKEAPSTVANFVGLARGQRPFLDPKTEKWEKRSFYDGLVFHRVIPGFMIQGGDVRGDGTGDPGYSIQDEKNEPHKFDKGGVMAMANRGPGTGGSQFFITEKETPFLEDRPGAHYQIFGQCKEADLVKKIAAVPKGARDRPEQDVKIVKVTIARKAGGGKKAAAEKSDKPAEKSDKPAADKK